MWLTVFAAVVLRMTSIMQCRFCITACWQYDTGHRLCKVGPLSCLLHDIRGQRNLWGLDCPLLTKGPSSPCCPELYQSYYVSKCQVPARGVWGTWNYCSVEESCSTTNSSTSHTKSKFQQDANSGSRSCCTPATCGFHRISQCCPFRSSISLRAASLHRPVEPWPYQAMIDSPASLSHIFPRASRISTEHPSNPGTPGDLRSTAT